MFSFFLLQIKKLKRNLRGKFKQQKNLYKLKESAFL